MTDCPHHSGVEAELRAVCAKMNEREKFVNQRFDVIQRDVVLAKELADKQISELTGALKELNKLLQPLVQASGERIGSSKWTTYILTVLVSAGIVLLLKLMHI